MTNTPRMPAFRLLRPRVVLAALGTLLAVAVPVTALAGLPVGLPSAGQHVDTPAGSIDASASGQGASTCYDLATPGLPAIPAVPAVPVPLPVQAPALPSTYAGSAGCVGAGLDGASADVGIDAAGSYVGTGVDAQSPVSGEDLDATSGEAQGFFQSLLDNLFGWI